MAISAAKENILKRIRQALSNPVPLPFPHSEGAQSVFTPAQDDTAIIFAQEFTKLQGKFAFCPDAEDLKKQLALLIQERGWTKIYYREDPVALLLRGAKSSPDLASCDVSITGCECLVARTGTIVMSSAQQSGRTTSVYAPIHICVAYSNQLMYDLKDAFAFLKEKYQQGMPSLISFASGPSRTADIEKTLVTGVHGPKEVYCFLVEA
ncbi:MAG TPA: lactate utilization protein [Ferruginibacter sp.]|nr:lactate utilization protein [Ferruginibacter sp.]